MPELYFSATRKAAVMADEAHRLPPKMAQGTGQTMPGVRNVSNNGPSAAPGYPGGSSTNAAQMPPGQAPHPGAAVRRRPQVRCPRCYNMVNLPATHCRCGTDLRTGHNPELERLELLAYRKSALKKLTIVMVIVIIACWQVWAALDGRGNLVDLISRQMALLMEPAKIEQRVLTEKEKAQAEAAITRAKGFMQLTRLLMAPANMTAEERAAWAAAGNDAGELPLPIRSFLALYMLNGGPDRIVVYQDYRREMLIRMLDEINPEATDEVVHLGLTKKLNRAQSMQLMAAINQAMINEGVLNAQEAREAAQRAAATTRANRLQAARQPANSPAAPAQ